MWGSIIITKRTTTVFFGFYSRAFVIYLSIINDSRRLFRTVENFYTNLRCRFGHESTKAGPLLFKRRKLVFIHLGHLLVYLIYFNSYSNYTSFPSLVTVTIYYTYERERERDPSAIESGAAFIPTLFNFHDRHCNIRADSIHSYVKSPYMSTSPAGSI